MRSAFHVAFVAPRLLVVGAVEALEACRRERAPRPLEEALGAAWRERERRRARTLAPFDPGARREIAGRLGDDAELGALLGAAPSAGRRAAILDGLRLSGLLARLRELEAPAVVRAATRARLRAALAAIDPCAPWPDEPPPLLATVGGTGVGGAGAGGAGAGPAAIVNLHAWLGDLLAALAPGPLVGLGGEIAGWPVPAPSAAAARDEAAAPAPALAPTPAPAPGIELTCYGMDPADPRWRAPALTLPRPLWAGALVVVGMGGGPATFALAGDEPGAATDPRLARLARSLPDDAALVSFVARETDVERSWACGEPGGDPA